MKIKKNTMKNSKHTRVIREHSIAKPSNTVFRKRVMMLTRRLKILMSEKTSLEENNKDILDSLKSEKLLSASLKKESFYWQRLYHEAELTINSYKVRQNDLVQAMSACLRDTDALYPHMVALSDKVTNNKIKLTSAINSVRTSDCGLPRQVLDKGKENEPTSDNAKPKYHHRVGPMVKGMLITKPKILLKRVMIPPPQEQEQESPTSDPTMMEGNALTPIPEEREHEESIEMRSVTIRPRHKLGRGWQRRRQAQLERNRERDSQRGNSSPARVRYNGESSDAESNVPTMNHMEPVVRVRDVSRLLQNSSLLKASRQPVPVDEQDFMSPLGTEFHGFATPDKYQAERNKKRLQSLIKLVIVKSSSEMDGPPNLEGNGDGGGNSKRTSKDDPLEGSSWMFTNNVNRHKTFPLSSPKCARLSSIYKSDSSDDEEDTIIESRNISNVSVNTLVLRNGSLNTTTSKRISVDNQNENNANSPINAEPDSTNNIDDHQFSNSSDNSAHSSSSYHVSENELTHSNNDSIALNSLACNVQLLKSNINSPTVRLSNVLHDSSSLLGSSRNSSYCNNCSPMISSPDLGKRVRKPKVNLYPGEEEYNELPKQAKCTVGKKTSHQNIKSKARKSNGTRLSLATGRLSGSEFCESSNKMLDACKNTKIKVKNLPVEKKSLSGMKNKRLSSTDEPSIGESSESSKKIHACKNTKMRARNSSEKKSLSGKKRNRLSSSMEELSRDESSESSRKNVKKKEPSTMSTAAKKTNTSSLKRSLYTSRTSSYGNTSSIPSSPSNQGAETSRPRRTASIRSYKESPLNTKQRRP